MIPIFANNDLMKNKYTHSEEEKKRGGKQLTSCKKAFTDDTKLGAADAMTQTAIQGEKQPNSSPFDTQKRGTAYERSGRKSASFSKVRDSEKRRIWRPDEVNGRDTSEGKRRGVH